MRISTYLLLFVMAIVCVSQIDGAKKNKKEKGVAKSGENAPVEKTESAHVATQKKSKKTRQNDPPAVNIGKENKKGKKTKQVKANKKTKKVKREINEQVQVNMLDLEPVNKETIQIKEPVEEKIESEPESPGPSSSDNESVKTNGPTSDSDSSTSTKLKKQKKLKKTKKVVESEVTSDSASDSETSPNTTDVESDVAVASESDNSTDEEIIVETVKPVKVKMTKEQKRLLKAEKKLNKFNAAQLKNSLNSEQAKGDCAPDGNSVVNADALETCENQ